MLVALGDPLVVRLALLLVRGQAIDRALLLLLGHRVPLLRALAGGLLRLAGCALRGFLELVCHGVCVCGVC